MVNTTMNHTKEFKPMKYTWIDIDAPRQAVHFKPISESEETPTFKQMQGASKNNTLKTQVLANSLWDIVHRFNNQRLVSEDADVSEMQDFFKTSSWKDFKHHAEMMGEFLHINQDEMTEAINTFENQLRELGGEEGVE